MNLFKLINEYETIANEKPLIKSINEYLKLAQDYSGDYTTANDHWVFKSQDSKTKALFGDTDKGKHVSAEEVIAQMTDYSGVKFVGTADNGNLVYDWTHSKYCHVRFYVLSESQLSEKLKSELIDGDLSSYEQIFTKVAVKPLHDYNEDLKIGKWYVFSFDEFTKLDTKFGRLSSMFEKLYNSNNPNIDNSDKYESNNVNKSSSEPWKLDSVSIKNVEELLKQLNNLDILGPGIRESLSASLNSHIVDTLNVFNTLKLSNNENEIVKTIRSLKGIIKKVYDINQIPSLNIESKTLINDLLTILGNLYNEVIGD